MSCHKSDQRCRPFKVQCPRMILHLANSYLVSGCVTLDGGDRTLIAWDWCMIASLPST